MKAFKDFEIFELREDENQDIPTSEYGMDTLERWQDRDNDRCDLLYREKDKRPEGVIPRRFRSPIDSYLDQRADNEDCKNGYVSRSYCDFRFR